MVDQISGSGASFLQQKIETLFNKIDSNSDGTIDKSEFQQLFSSMMKDKDKTPGTQAAGLDTSKLFAAMDTNNDGTISKSEFAEFSKVHKHHSGHHGGKIASALTSASTDPDSTFSAIDTNKDGVIELSELIAYIEQQASSTQQASNSSGGTTSSAGSV